MKKEFNTESFHETQKIAEDFAKDLNPPAIIAFDANLGGGKTTFIQGLAKGLGISANVISPTFVLERIYEVPEKEYSLHHYDLYRIEPDDILVSEILENARDNIIAIEWAEKIKDLLPQNTIWVKLENTGENTRKITIEKDK
ncbi:MAG: tRNA (adenosine(37)-N6)-threonylcarbamoyltransferase complex ATPase subunit type 1 TsaE [Patescibacteria group bacterium]|nr:tRNA (adenosine(37)-N6)-threonylcarbamoyltransferase complex ATPase subunit type 1 TsaE [Patescibacteria group bacterium]